jgi:hypothetical protein
LGSKDPVALIAAATYAAVLADSGKTEQAFALAESTRKLAQGAVGPNHESTLMCEQVLSHLRDLRN